MKIRNMDSVYWKRSTEELLLLRSQKLLRRASLREAWLSYPVQQEIRILNQQIDRISAILAARADQLSFEDWMNA